MKSLYSGAWHRLNAQQMLHAIIHSISSVQHTYQPINTHQSPFQSLGMQPELEANILEGSLFTLWVKLALMS